MKQANKIKLLLFLLLACLSVSSAAKDFVVIIDAGHGGFQGGAIYNKVKEKTVNLEVSKLVRDKLKNEHKDVKVVMTREKDVFIELKDRAALSNRIKPDLFISIHCNAIAGKAKQKKIYGAYAVVMNASQMQNLDKYTDKQRLQRLESFELSLKAGNYILDELEAIAGRKRGGFHQSLRDLALLREVWAPSVIVELDYLSYPEANKFLASKDGKEKCAKAVCEGIIKYKEYLEKIYDDSENDEEVNQ